MPLKKTVSIHKERGYYFANVPKHPFNEWIIIDSIIPLCFYCANYKFKSRFQTMRQPFNTTYLTPTKHLRRLSVLMCIHHKATASQNIIAERTCLSSSMVNNYIKQLKQEKLLTVSGETNRTRSYHLTKWGMQYLREHLLDYSASIVQIYIEIKQEISAILNNFCEQGISTAVLFGVAETAEVVYAAIQNTAMKIVDVVDSDILKQGKIFNGYLIKSPQHLKNIKPDAVVITSFARQEEIYRDIRQIIDRNIKIIKLSDL